MTGDTIPTPTQAYDKIQGALAGPPTRVFHEGRTASWGKDGGAFPQEPSPGNRQAVNRLPTETGVEGEALEQTGSGVAAHMRS